jgi:hypothetical protein
MKQSLLAIVVLILAFPAPPLATNPNPASNVPWGTVSPQDLWLKTISPTFTGRIHTYCKKFADPEAVVSRGRITRIDVYHGDVIHGVRLWYGSDNAGLPNGFTEPYSHLRWDTWDVPDGERITRVEGEISGDYVTRLQFFPERGKPSPPFGKKRGKPFAAADPGKGALRTISGWANFRQHPALTRAITSLTFQFGAPYFVKKIEVDQNQLDIARLKAIPEKCASQDFTNQTSLEQSSTYTNTLTLTKTTKLTFEQTFGLKLSAEVWAEASVLVVSGGGSMKWEASAEVKSGQSFSTSREESVSWSVPVKVPPHARIVASSTWRKYRVSIPFTYTIAWYVGTKDNIKKEVTLPGLYEDVRVDDLKHDFAEAKLK